MNSTERHTDSTAYAAFISYRHLPHDAEVACAVQKAIEAFRLPRGVQLSHGATSTGSRHLGKCFRDEDELAATHSLPASIHDALAQSASLVLICSPDTQASPWVRREIETFIELHGRERIVCVLADGNSETSIPSILKTQFVPDAQGILREMPAEPLAADLRPESRGKRKTELLRIIAAVAGCNYDDLRRREQARRRKRIALSATALAAIVALIGAFAFQAHSASRAAQQAESVALAAESHEQLARGERRQALETALAALPSSETDQSRPLVPEARIALEEALELYRDIDQHWHPLFTIDSSHPIEQLAIGNMGEWIAAMDERCVVTIYDGITAQKLCSIDLRDYTTDPDNMEPDEWRIVGAGRNHLLLTNCTGEGSFAAFEAKTGKELWREEEALVSGIALDEMGNFAAVFSATAEGSMLLGMYDIETGELLGWGETEPLGFRQSERFLPAAFSIDSAFAAVSASNLVLSVYLEDLSYTLMPLDDAPPGSANSTMSLAIADKYLVGSMLNLDSTFAAEADDRVGLDYGYLLGAQRLSETGVENLWSTDGTYSFTTNGATNHPISYDGLPRIHGFVKDGGLGALCSTGRVLSVLACEDGEELYHEQFRGSIVTAASFYLEQNEEVTGSAIFFVTSDGIIDSRHLANAEASRHDSFQYTTPYQIDDAEIAVAGSQGVTVVVHAANQPTRLIAYHYPAQEDPTNPEDYSLDELIAKAHELLGDS
ncbi:MAG: TIR domain-containing protein [Adlercreutzia sp.]|nr:TIR domain-containing protein [Adlercreutzia sp.]